jgi:hypothetical protein
MKEKAEEILKVAPGRVLDEIVRFKHPMVCSVVCACIRVARISLLASACVCAMDVHVRA